MTDNRRPIDVRQGEADDRPWWRHGMVWLVIGGPAAVVVAAVVTAVIAYRGADLLVVEPPAARQTVTRPDAVTPAMQARNHAATPATSPAASR